MPELPEVETVCRGLAAVLTGQHIRQVDLHRSGLRLPFPPGLAASLQGRCIIKIWRRAKYYQWLLDDDQVLLGHLGMSGTFDLQAHGSNFPPAGKHDHVVITTCEGSRVAYRDPRRFGVMTLTTLDQLPSHPLLQGLGPEPLSADFTAEALLQATARRKGPLKPALMDASLVVGIGNIYASESLFRAGISPLRPAGSLTPGEATRLVEAIRTVLTEAIAAGGSSLRDHRQVSGELGYFQHTFAVYGRTGAACPNCHCDLSQTGGIKRIVQGGRSTFYCAEKQRG